MKFTYYPAVPGEPDSLGLLYEVQAYDRDDTPLGLWARYYYESRPNPHSSQQYERYLNRVDYSDGTQATYQWEYNNGQPYIKVADDPHYASAGGMRHIEYGNFTGGSPGEWKQYSNGSGTLVSRYKGVDPVDGYRTVQETRGDGATRKFMYNKTLVNDCPPPHGDEPDTFCPGPFYDYLMEFTDFKGKLTTIEYYDSQFIQAVTDANNHRTEYIRGYSGTGYWAITRINYPDGSFIEQEFTDHANPYYLASRTALRKDGDEEHRTIYKREDSSNPNAITQIEYPDGAIETFTYNGKGQILTHRMKNGAYERFRYDSIWRLTDKWNPKQNAVPDDTDPKTTYTYYEAGDPVAGNAWIGRVKTETLPPNASGLQASMTYEYDRHFEDDTEFGFKIDKGLPGAGRGFVTKIIHADGKFQEFRHNIYGDKIWETNELGKRTVYAYDEYGRVTSVTDPNSNITSNDYTPWGQSSSLVTTSSLPFVTTLPSGKRTEFYYDPNWRKTRVREAPGITGQEANTYFTYDDVGNLKTQTNPRGRVTTYWYDSLNRVKDVDDPMLNASPEPHKNSRNHTISYDYYGSGMKEREIRANNQQIHYDTYDEMNRPLQITTQRDTNIFDVRHMTYDDAGNIETRTDERGNIYAYGYDASGRKQSLQYPPADANTPATSEYFYYDNAGNPWTHTTRAGQIVTFGYDNRNREKSSVWNDGTPGVNKTYDDAGRLLVEISSVSCISDTYDDGGRLTSETQQILPNKRPKSVIYHYDGSPGSPGKDGLRTSIDYPYGSTVAYGYTNRNQIQSISSGSISATYAYDANGNEGTRTLTSNGASESCTYNDVDRLTSLNHVKSGTSFSRFDYTHNKVNDCLTRTETAAAVAKLDKFAYDLDDQVKEARYNFNSQNDTQDRLCNYNYDPAGNRTDLTDTVNGQTNYAVNNLNQYTVAGGDTPQYDPNGNLSAATVAGVGWNYGYDAQNRLVNAESHQKKVDFVYDTRNRCTTRTAWTRGPQNQWVGTPTFFYYDGWELIEEHDANATLLARYIHGAREDEMIAKIDSYGTVYYHTDAEGSVVALTNTSGTVIERYKYDAFGKPSFFDSTSQPINGSTVGNRFLFTGREWLPDLGLYDYRNRVYSPEFGRFLQTDPKSFDADPSNLYRYCGNDPIDKTDPMGLEGTNTYPLQASPIVDQGPDTRGAMEKSRVYEGIREMNATASGVNAREQAKSVRLMVRTKIEDNSVGQAGMKTKQVVNLNQDGTYTSSSYAGSTNIGISRVKGEFSSSTNVTPVAGAPGTFNVAMRGYAVSRPLMWATAPAGYVLFSIHYSVNITINFSNRTAVGYGYISGYPSSSVRVGRQQLFHHQESRIPLVDLMPRREVPVEGHTEW